MSAVEREWARIEAWMRTNAPEYFHVNPPADAAALDRLAAGLGRPVPEELATLLSRANGAGRLARTRVPDARWDLFSTERILNNWKVLDDIFRELTEDMGPEGLAARVSGPMHPVQWSASWIPIASNGGGDVLCVDTDPAPGGRVGQLIHYQRGYDQRDVLFPSIAAMLQSFADGLERGDYVVEPYVGVVPRTQDV